MEEKVCDLLLTGDVLDVSYEIRRDQAIAVTEGKITEVGALEKMEKRYQCQRKIDRRGMLWMPGLTDGHMHTGQQLLRGKILDELPMIWTRIMLPFESTLTPAKMRLSADLAALEMITSGTTSFVEAGSYFMESAAEAYEQSGLRGALSCSTMDASNLPDSIRMNYQEAIAQTDALYEQLDGNERMKVFYSLRSLLSCSEKLIALAAERAQEKGTFLQAHMNEYTNEVQFFLEKYQKRPIAFLAERGYIGERTLFAHCLFTSEEEIEIMAENDVKVIHCPFSNCGKAVPNTPAMLKRNISVGFGTDGTAHGGMSLFNEMKIFRSVMNVHHGVALSQPDIMPAKQILQMALEGGAAAAGEEGNCGKIEAGYCADVICVNTKRPHLFPTNNVVNTIVESVNAGDIEDMIVGGTVLMEKREVKTIDQEAVLYEVQKLFG